jgi:hypothetical protein
MMTLAQRLAISRNLETVQDFCETLAGYGIDPQHFVDWLCNEGVQHYENGSLHEGAQEWLESELLISEGWQDYVKAGLKGAGTGAVVGGLGGGLGMLGGAVVGGLTNMAGLALKNYFGNKSTTPSPTSTGPVDPTEMKKQSATRAVADLSKRIQQSPSLQAMLGGPGEAGKLTQALTSLLSTIQNKLHEALLSPEQRLAENLQHLRQEIELKNTLLDLVELGIDPKAVFDWYVEDHVMINENILQRVGDWWSRTKANVADAWSKWGQAGKEKQAEIDKQRDIAAMQAVMDQLADLESHLGSAGKKATIEFAKFAKEVKDKLAPVLGASPAPSDASDPTPADPVPVDQRKLDAAKNILKMNGVTTMPPDDLVKELYKKSTAFVQAKSPDTATKKAWWKNVAAAIVAGKDPLAAADAFNPTSPSGDNTDPTDPTPKSDPVPADPKPDPRDNREPHIIQLEDQILKKLGAPKDQLKLLNYGRGSSMVNGVSTSTSSYRWAKKNDKGQWEMTDSPEPIVYADTPEVKDYLEKAAKYMLSGGPKPELPDPPKPDDKEKKDDSPEVAPLPQSGADSDGKQKTPSAEDMNKSRETAKFIFDAIQSILNGQPYQYKGETFANISDFSKLGINAEEQQELVKWFEDNDKDPQKAKEAMLKVIDDLTGSVSDSYILPDDQKFFESVLGKTTNRAAGWFSF